MPWLFVVLGFVNSPIIKIKIIQSWFFFCSSEVEKNMVILVPLLLHLLTHPSQSNTSSSVPLIFVQTSVAFLDFGLGFVGRSALHFLPSSVGLGSIRTAVSPLTISIHPPHPRFSVFVVLKL